MWPCKKIFFTSKFIYVCMYVCMLLFCHPTHKTEAGIANRCETTNSKPPGPIIMMGESETHWVAVRSYLLHSFSAGAQRCCDFTSHGKRAQLLCLSQNQFPELNQHVLDYLLCRITWRAPLEMLLRGSFRPSWVLT
jgi:hypothetical protein